MEQKLTKAAIIESIHEKLGTNRNDIHLVIDELFEEINSFLKRYGYTKVQLIEAGYKALQDDAAEHNLALGKLVDGYDDFFSSELEAFEKQKKDN